MTLKYTLVTSNPYPHSRRQKKDLLFHVPGFKHQNMMSNTVPLLAPLSCEQQQEQDPTNLYISNLPLSVDEKELHNMLQPFGQVVSTRILRDYSGSSRGVGFARWVARPAPMPGSAQDHLVEPGPNGYNNCLSVTLNIGRCIDVYCIADSSALQ